MAGHDAFPIGLFEKRMSLKHELLMTLRCCRLASQRLNETKPSTRFALKEASYEILRSPR